MWERTVSSFRYQLVYHGLSCLLLPCHLWQWEQGMLEMPKWLYDVFESRYLPGLGKPRGLSGWQYFWQTLVLDLTGFHPWGYSLIHHLLCGQEVDEETFSFGGKTAWKRKGSIKLNWTWSKIKEKLVRREEKWAKQGKTDKRGQSKHFKWDNKWSSVGKTRITIMVQRVALVIAIGGEGRQKAEEEKIQRRNKCGRGRQFCFMIIFQLHIFLYLILLILK